MATLSVLASQRRSGLELLICRCQEFAGRTTDTDPAVLFAELGGLTCGVPDLLSVPELLLMRSLLIHALGRIVRLAHLDVSAGELAE